MGGTSSRDKPQEIHAQSVDVSSGFHLIDLEVNSAGLDPFFIFGAIIALTLAAIMWYRCVHMARATDITPHLREHHRRHEEYRDGLRAEGLDHNNLSVLMARAAATHYPPRNFPAPIAHSSPRPVRDIEDLEMTPIRETRFIREPRTVGREQGSQVSQSLRFQ